MILKEDIDKDNNRSDLVVEDGDDSRHN